MTTPMDVETQQSGSELKPNYKLKYIMSGHSASISSIKFSYDGSTLATAGVFIDLGSARSNRSDSSRNQGKVLTR